MALRFNTNRCLEDGLRDVTATRNYENKKELIYFENCEGCTLTLTGRAIKLVFTNCKNCTFRLNLATITGHLELVRCENVTIHFETTYQTVSADSLTDCVFHFNEDWNGASNHTVVSSLCTDLKIKVPDQDTLYVVPNDQDVTIQHITRRMDGKIVSEVAVREGGGYVAPKSQSEVADQLQEANRKRAAATAVIDAQLRRAPAPAKATRTMEVPSFPEPAAAAEPSVIEGATIVPTAELGSAPTAGDKAAGSTSDLLANFNRANLRPTETRVTTVAAVIERSGATGHGHHDAEAVREFYDAPDVLQEKIKTLAAMIREARHMVVYTGAGVSTSAKIPDYRGPQGVWTMADRGLRVQSMTTLEQAEPTVSHRAIKGMMDAGRVQHVVSTNLDGLHRRSGIPARQMSELHGNAYKEWCNTCNHEYLRMFDCTKNGTRQDHKTGRLCEQPNCPGELLDNIVNFGETLPAEEFHKAETNSDMGDLALVMGTSMLVSPACHLPSRVVSAGGAMVIINLQKTPFDNVARLRIFAKTDDVMKPLMEALELEIPPAAGWV